MSTQFDFRVNHTARSSPVPILQCNSYVRRSTTSLPCRSCTHNKDRCTLIHSANIYCLLSLNPSPTSPHPREDCQKVHSVVPPHARTDGDTEKQQHISSWIHSSLLSSSVQFPFPSLYNPSFPPRKTSPSPTIMAEWFFSSCKRPKTLSFDSRNDPDSGVDVSLADLVVERSDPLHDHHPNSNDDGNRGSTDGRPTGDYIRSPSYPRSRGVAVVKYSKEPYFDFRQSMMEMMEANHVKLGEKPDMDFMGRLLDRYLELNDRSVHDDIRRAFDDLTRS